MREVGSGLALRFAKRAAVPALAIALVLGVVASPVGAASQDTRATPESGNVTTCAQVGFASDTQVGSTSDGNASDTNVSGTVSNNGEDLDVTISSAGTNAGVVIDAIVVKGGDNYNLYTNQQYLPPQLASDQNYDSPPNGGGNIPTISHWFVCYNTGGTPEPLGTIGIAGASGLAAIGLGFVLWRARRRRSMIQPS